MLRMDLDLIFFSEIFTILRSWSQHRISNLIIFIIDKKRSSYSLLLEKIPQNPIFEYKLSLKIVNFLSTSTLRIDLDPAFFTDIFTKLEELGAKTEYQSWLFSSLTRNAPPIPYCHIKYAPTIPFLSTNCLWKLSLLWAHQC